MVTAQQARSVGGFQARLVPMQAGALPATVVGAQIDMNSIMNMMLIMVVMVMMMKMMGGITGMAKTPKETGKGLWEAR